MLVLLLLVVGLIVWFIGIYNKLIHLIEAVRNNQKQIDIQLDRRFKVFESLINVVKNYMDYETLCQRHKYWVIMSVLNQLQAINIRGEQMQESLSLLINIW